MFSDEFLEGLRWICRIFRIFRIFIETDPQFIEDGIEYRIEIISEQLKIPSFSSKVIKGVTLSHLGYSLDVGDDRGVHFHCHRVVFFTFTLFLFDDPEWRGIFRIRVFRVFRVFLIQDQLTLLIGSPFGQILIQFRTRVERNVFKACEDVHIAAAEYDDHGNQDDQ